MRLAILLSSFLVSASIFAGGNPEAEMGKRVNPWQVVMDEKDNDIPKGKAIFKVVLHSNEGTMYLKKNHDTEWKKMWESDSSRDHFHTTLDTGKYDIKFEKPGDYHVTRRTIHLKNQHFYEARVYIHRLRRLNTKKPAIYLYSNSPTTLNLNFKANGNVNFVYPTKPNNGWKIQTQPDGKLLVDDKSYDYLFWEGDRPVPAIDQTLGFNVASTEVIPFLEEQLTSMGLNAREKQDFIAYWGPQMVKNKLNFVQFMVGESYNTNIATIESDKNMDTEIRVFMVYKSVEAPVAIIEQTFEAPERTGLTLVEWGGGELPNTELDY